MAGCDAASKAAWAAAIGLPLCIADAWCATHAQLPATMTELDNWGNATGYQVNNQWTCTPVPPATCPAGYVKNAQGQCVPTSGGGTDFSKLLNNPLVLIGGGLVAIAVFTSLTGGRR